VVGPRGRRAELECDVMQTASELFVLLADDVIAVVGLLKKLDFPRGDGDKEGFCTAIARVWSEPS